jgi:hypothetical protein
MRGHRAGLPDPVGKTTVRILPRILHVWAPKSRQKLTESASARGPGRAGESGLRHETGREKQGRLGENPNDRLFLEMFSYTVLEAPQILEFERDKEKEATNHHVGKGAFK